MMGGTIRVLGFGSLHDVTAKEKSEGLDQGLGFT